MRQFLHLQNGPESGTKAAGGRQRCGVDKARLRPSRRDARGAACKGRGRERVPRASGQGEGPGPIAPAGGGGEARCKSRRALRADVSSSRHWWSPHRLGAHDPYISVPHSGAGVRSPTPTLRRKKKVRSAAGTHLLQAAASRRRRLYGRYLH